MEKLTVKKLLENPEENKHYVLEGMPTGMYADRQSYGNRPILLFILDNELACKATARPVSTRPLVVEGSREIENMDLTNIWARRSFDSESEYLGLAAAFIDQAIRQKSQVEVHGNYIEGILELEFLRTMNRGFSFSRYNFPNVEQED